MTFRDEYLPRNEPDAGELVDRATVIAHEMAHMWFGDLVTMKWWQDTWLNESFADFMGYHVAHEAGVLGSWPDFSLNRKPTGYAADGRRSTHPIAEDAEHLVDVDTAFTNFDMITYAKGASVLHQLVIWLGLGHLRQGHERLPDPAPVRQRRAGRLPRGARLGDRARRARLGRGLPAHHRLRHDPGDPRRRRAGARPRGLAAPPVQRGRPRRAPSGVEHAGWSTWRREPVALPAFAGAAVIPNAADEAYAAVLLDDLSWQAAVDGLSALPDPLLRAVTWTNASTRVRSGAGAARRLPRRSCAATSPPRPTRSSSTACCGGWLRQVLPQWTAPEALRRGRAGRWPTSARPRSRPATPTAGWPRCGGSRRRPPTPTCCSAGSRRGEARPGLAVDRDTRWLVVRRLVALGEAGADLVAAEAAADRSSSGHQASLTALASRPDAAAKAEAWERIDRPGRVQP